MNNVAISADGLEMPLWSEKARDFALKVLKETGHKNWDLSILFCGDEIIKNLNAEYRNKDEATDILSFNLGETVKDGENTVFLPGDIVISLETLKENAKYFNTQEDEELRRLIIHGILHLDGMDHETNDPDEKMLVLQEEILNKLKNMSIIISGAEK